MSMAKESEQALPSASADNENIIAPTTHTTGPGNKDTREINPAVHSKNENEDEPDSSGLSSQLARRELSPPTAASELEYTPGPSPSRGTDATGDEDESVNDAKASIKFLLRVFTYNDKVGWIMNAIAFVCMVASGTVLPLMDLVFGKFVNVFNDFVTGALTPEGFRSEVNRFSLFFVYLFIGRFILTYIWTILISITGIRTVKELRIDFLRQMLRQEVPFFDRPSSSVSGQITTNGNLISNGISEKLGITIQGISTFTTAFAVAFAVHWKLTLIVISIIPVNLIINIVCVWIDTSYEHAMFDIYSLSGALAEEAFSSIRTAHAFWAFPKLSRKFNQILDDAAKIGAKKSYVYAILFPVEFFCIFAGYGLAFWQGIRMYSEGEIDNPGTVLTVIFAILVAAQALTQIAPQTIAISKATAAATDLFSIIDRQSSVDSLSAEGSQIPEFRGEIKFRNVRFAYPSRPNVPVLHGLDLDVPAGKTTALVGASGSGKSTILGLLERWYLPIEGEITLDEMPIDQLNLQWLRTNIRLVQQEPTLFSGSIYRNVVDGLTGTVLDRLPEDEKRALVLDSCKAAFAHDFIESLPQGYETIIGERGASLSGGQKQRIVIARSIISNPKVLLLDEATSALDPNAEKVVQKALNNVAKGRTMIVIAHRLSTIRDADNIIVMSKGRTIEQGTHDQLIAQEGAYDRLVKAQDLGHGPSPAEDPEEEQDIALQDGDPASSNPSSPRSELVSSGASEDNEGLSLLGGIWRVIMEQRILWAPMAAIFMGAIMGGATYPALAVLFSRTMEAFETIDVEKGNFFALMFFVVSLGNFVAYGFAGWYSNVVAQHVMRVYRGELFQTTMRQDMAFFDQPEHGAGALASRLSSDPTSLQELMSMNLALILINIINLLSSVVLAIIYGWKLGLVLGFGALPLLVASGYVRIRLEFKFDEDTSERFARSSALASEAVLAIRTVSSLALENAIVARYRDSLESIAKNSIGGLGWKMMFYSLSQSISFLAMGLGFWYGGRLVSTGEYNTSQFYVVFIATIFSGESAASFFQYSTSISKARTALNYIFSLRQQQALDDSDRPNQDPAGDGTSEATLVPGVEMKNVGGMAVNFRGVDFAYPLRPKLRVLRDVDVDIPPGKMVAFVGASGCGKSTMIGLLERFYDPSTGVIRVNSQNIQSYDRRVYRRDVALVQQEPVLYQGSIRDNIALGIERIEHGSNDAKNEDEKAIIEACREANIWHFVASLPEGLDTPCGNQGLALSGGQRQRIAIARALIRSPRLLLLDEATSALDSESERVVQTALDRAAAGRTTVAVAHRLSTIRGADTIVVFERGRVAQVGTHDELVAHRGLYYDMVQGQSLDREAV